MKAFRRLRYLVGLVIMMIFMATCDQTQTPDPGTNIDPVTGETSTSTTNSSSGSGSILSVLPAGAVKLKMTDFPLNDENIVGVLIDIRKVAIYTANYGWVDVIDYGDTGKHIDLLKLQNGKTDEIGFFQLETGTYDQIRLYLNDNNHIIVRGPDGILAERPLTVPSGVQTGIKLVKSFTVSEIGITEILVDFNAQKSVVHNQGQGYILQPTIKVTGVSTRQARGLLA